MRILAAHPGPRFSVHDVYVGWVEALRELGVQVGEFNLDERLAFYEQTHLPDEAAADGYRKALSQGQAIELAVNGLLAACYRVRPDVLFAVSAFFLPPPVLDLVRAHGTRVVLLHTESPYEDDRQLGQAAHADLNLLNDPTNLDRFPAGTTYLPHAYRPAIHHPGPPRAGYGSDLVMVGTGYRSRIEFLEACDLDGVEVAMAGNWQQLEAGSPLRKHMAHDLDECCDNTEAADLYRSARAGLNLYRRESQRPELAAGWAMGPREVEMAACGLFYLRESRAEGDQLLPMLPTFTGPADFSDQLRWWLSHDAARESAAAAARAAVAERTFTRNARTLMRHLGA